MKTFISKLSKNPFSSSFKRIKFTTHTTVYSPVQTGATLQANSSQQCWTLHAAPVCAPCRMFLGVVAQSLNRSNFPVGANGRNIVGGCRVRLHVAYSVTFSYLIWLQKHSNRCFKCVAIPLFYQVLIVICVLIKHLYRIAHESFVFVLFCFLLKVYSELNCPLDLVKSR